jgi:hypothetical protein
LEWFAGSGKPLITFEVRNRRLFRPQPAGASLPPA